MVENLQSLCENTGNDFGWQLRSTLQSEPQIMLLATATSRFEALDDAEQPFFELFRTVALQPLDTAACQRLWQTISGDAVSQREIRPLEILTGGSPRLLVILAGFAGHRSLRQLMKDLAALIDDHTEYFRGHLEVLGKTERRVYLAVIDLWQPSSTSEIAARARMDVRPVSALLGRLVNRGAVIVEGSGRKLRYAAAERLYSIYYKLRRERDEAAVVQNLIRFMAAFYSPPELAEMSWKMRLEAIASPAIREGIERALIEQPEIGSIFSGAAWRGEADRIAEQTAEIDDGRVIQLFEEIKEALKEKRYDKVIESVDQTLAFWNTISNQASDPFIARFCLMKAFAHGQLGDFQTAIVAYGEMVNRFGVSDTPEIQEYIAVALVGKGVMRAELGDYDGAIATCDDVVERFGTSNTPELQVWIAEALAHKGEIQDVIGHMADALRTCEELEGRLGALSSDEENEFAWRAMCMRTAVLLIQRKRQAAVDAFRSAYGMSVPGNEMMLKKLLQLVPALIAAGVSEHDLIEILLSDRTKSDAFLSLVVALRQRAGEAVRAPTEVLEVAEDVRKRIEEMT